MGTFITFGLGIAGHNCHVSVYPLSWLMFVQSGERGDPVNIAFGPFRLMFN